MPESPKYDPDQEMPRRRFLSGGVRVMGAVAWAVRRVLWPAAEDRMTTTCGRSTRTNVWRAAIARPTACWTPPR